MAAKCSHRAIKTVFTLHGLSMLDPGYKTWPIVKYIYRQYFRFFLRWIDQSVFVSRANYDLAKTQGLVKASRVIHNGIDQAQLNFLSTQDARKYLSDRIGSGVDTAFLIGSIGRLSYAKNYEFLIRIFPRFREIHPQARLVIIGEGEKRREYEEIIEQNNLAESVFLVGAIPEAHRYLKAFDLFILPSRYEGFSITLIETLFAGLPVLASDVGGNREIIQDERMLYPSDNAAECIHAFSWLADADNREIVTPLITAKASQFDVSETTDAYLRLYRQLVESKM
jgi:glycosyltransferase involved in cell wall biosynthesis